MALQSTVKPTFERIESDRVKIGDVAVGTSNEIRVFVSDKKHVIMLDDEDEPIFLSSKEAGRLSKLLRAAADKCDE